MSIDKLNSHFYDGKIEIKIAPLNITQEEKYNTFRNILIPLISQTNSSDKDMAITAINLMLSDTKNNYDVTDNIFACDLLYIICIKIKDKKEIWNDLNGVIMQQLADINGGSCPTGRVKRIMQIYLLL